MSFKPYYQICNKPASSQFSLKDFQGTLYQVVEWYNTDPRQDLPYLMLEFYPDSQTDPNALRPRVWIELKKWKVLEGKGQNIPDSVFESAVEAFLAGWSETQKETRIERCSQSRFIQAISTANQGYSVAFQELFPDELNPDDFPEFEIEGKTFLLDDQYLIQPGEKITQVTLIWVDSKQSDSSHKTEPALIANWDLKGGFDVLQSKFSEDQLNKVLESVANNSNLAEIYLDRMERMRQKAVRLGIHPKPFSPRSSST